MDMGACTAGGGDEKVRLAVTGAGNCGVDCDEGRGTGGGPMTESAGDGDSYLGGGVIYGKNGISGQGGAGEAETERDMYGGGNGTMGVTNVGVSDRGA